MALICPPVGPLFVCPPPPPRSQHCPRRYLLLKALARGGSSLVPAHTSVRPCWATGTQGPWGRGWQLPQPPQPCPARGLVVMDAPPSPTGQTLGGRVRGTSSSGGSGGTQAAPPPGFSTAQGLCQQRTRCCCAEVPHLPPWGPRDSATAPGGSGERVMAKAALWQPAPGWCSLTSAFLLLSAPLPPRWGSRCQRHPPPLHCTHIPRDGRGVPGAPPSYPSPPPIPKKKEPH